MNMKPTNRPYKGRMSRQSNGNGAYTHSDKATGTRWALHCNYNEDTGEKLGWMFEKIHDGGTREGSEEYHATLAEALDALDHYLATRHFDLKWGWVCDEEAETADQIKAPEVVKPRLTEAELKERLMKAIFGENYEPGIGATKPGHEDETDEEIVVREEEEQALENQRKAHRGG